MKKRKIRMLAALLISSMAFGSFGMPVHATETNAENADGTVQETEQMVEVTDAAAIGAVKESFEKLLQQKTIMATVYLTEFYPVREKADVDSTTIAELPSGSQVLFKGVEIADGMVWYQVSFGDDDVEKTGYIESLHLISTDEDFLLWEQEHLFVLDDGIEEALVRAGSEDINAFPESYREALTKLKAQHPNWTFVPMNVNVDFSTVITEEMRGDRSWVYYTKGEAWKGEARGSNWYVATQAAVEYCVDPRNFLNEQNIFMFEQLTYNESYHTADAVQDILKNSFMKGKIAGTETSYAQAFYTIGKGLNVSPFHLACRVYQEQGANGTSPLISGTYAGYEGFYNYFNVGATGVTNEAVITSGLQYAKNKGWNTVMLSLSGGAELISKNYILKGQDTLYLQKFDVDPSYYGMFSHQYQQNITAPITEGAQIRKAYELAGTLNNCFVFKIPVYKNMPTNACPEPGTASGPNYTEDQVAQLRAFVVRLYNQALGRTSYEESEIDYWFAKLKSGEGNGAEIAQGFFFSEEFKNRNLSNEAYVELLYQVMFNRSADEGGKANWLSALENGMTREYVYRGFANSDEFTAVCASYGVTRGTIILGAYRDQNEGVTAFVNRLYNKLFGRQGDATGMEDWCRVILKKENTVENVAYGFVFSQEFTNKNTSNEEFVKLMYRTFLDREYDDAGLADWVNKLNQGVSREEVFRGFARSAEFTNLMQKYGVM